MALVGFALIAFSIFLCYGFADRLARMLGRTAMTVITKLSSFLLVCIGVQIWLERYQGVARVCGPASGLTGRIVGWVNGNPRRLKAAEDAIVNEFRFKHL